VLRGETPAPFEDRHTRSDGTVVDVIVACTPLLDIHSKVVGLIASTRDITDRRRAEERVSHLASHDPLTDLYNRHRFQEELSAASAHAEKEGHQLAVLIVDLYDFKHVNESYGRDVGDEFVSALAIIFRHRLGEGDVLARLGGAEFGVLQARSDGACASRLAEELLESVRNHAMIVDGCEVHVGASIGITTFDGRGSSAAELLLDLDRAMYENSERGHDRVTIYSDADRVNVRKRMRSAGEHVIRDALRYDHFELFAQPIVNLTTGTTSQVEVLLRMRRNDELVSPAEFLPVAERSGLMHLVDFWVIAHALEVAARYPDLTFNLNLSGATIDDERLGSVVAQELRTSGAQPGRIVFELTETAAIRDLGRAREMAQQLVDLGCKFAIDDFGAGFSSFYYLKHFPADYVKIDGEFMKDPGSRINQLVIESTVGMARELGTETIAEYVVDEATLDRVRSLGVDYGQGYHFAKPYPIEQLQNAPRRLLELDRSQDLESSSPAQSS
jgi:diguanylate cyclase (GGDEF)-like protein